MSKARRWPIWGTVLMACLLLPTFVRSAQAGSICSNTTWRKADSPIVLSESIVVCAGATLTIEPGVVVKPGSCIAVQINGTLIARGTSTDPITFTSNAASPAKGDWGSIIFGDTSTDASFDADGNYLSGSILEHGTVEYAGSAGNHAVKLNASSPFISHCTIQNNLNDGINATYFDHPRNINFNEITGNGGNGIFININSSSSIITVSSNTVTSNGRDGINISTIFGTATVSSNSVNNNGGNGIKVWHQVSTMTVSHNLIKGNRGAINWTFHTGNGTISNNTITGNTASGTGNGSGTIDVTPLIPGSSNVTPSINHNNIYNNTSTYELVNDSSSGSPNLDATNNWWGTTDTTEIARRVYDFFDNPNRGIVDYDPYRWALPAGPQLVVEALFWGTHQPALRVRVPASGIR